MKIVIVIFLLACFNRGISQCATHSCDPQLTGFGFNVECFTLNGSAILTVGWALAGGDPSCTVPPGSWRIQVQLPLSGIYGSMSVSDVNGPGFSWVYSEINKTFTGTNNVQMNWLSGGNILINVTGLIANNCSPILSNGQISILPLFAGGCPQAFANNTGNDELDSGKGVQNVLPIDLSSFNARNGECGEVIIDWTTGFERNSDFMILERSSDNTNFEVVSKIKSVNDISGASYAFIDDKVLGGTKYLYRIRQVDIDGTETTFKIISVLTKQCSGPELNLTLYPNPALDKVNITLEGFHNKDKVKLIILNTIGETVGTIDNASLTNANEFKLVNIPAGIYSVKVAGFDDVISKRFIKID
ncbi:MAG: T9SS type A sorting domain-containing protein [Saprospiraceae bacterium]|nr:T9SS type A sorting domain-containing protein [Saprospiraceae bacterium]